MPGMENSVSVMRAPLNRPGRLPPMMVTSGNQRVAEGVLVDDRMLRQALGAGGADVVRVQHFQHIRAGVAHIAADGDDDQRCDGQHQMVGLIAELPPGVQLGIVTADEAVQIEPAELDREQQLEQRSKEEGGQRNTDQRRSRDDVVRAAVLLGSSQHAEGHGDHDGQHKGDAAHDDRQADDLGKLLGGGHVPLPAVAEVADDGLAQPGEEAGDNVQVKAVGRIELGQPFLIGFGTGGLGQLHCHRLGKGAGQAADQRVDNEHDTEQDQYRLRDTLDDVISQEFSFLPCTVRPRLFCREMP